jgi:hypothetical protein
MQQMRAALGLNRSLGAPIDGSLYVAPAALDEWLGIDFHLIDNLVNLFAKSQVGPWNSLEVMDCQVDVPWPGWQPGGSRGCPVMGGPCCARDETFCKQSGEPVISLV